MTVVRADVRVYQCLVGYMAWAGCIGARASGVPAIGSIEDAARCFAAMGFGGNGTTFSVIAAQIIQRAVLGLTDPDAELFALPR